MQLLKWHAHGACIAASCIGTFVLAETGLLDHREATTTWWLAPLFRQRYPHVRLDESRMLVSAGTVVTAGAAMGHLDLALWLIRTVSPQLSALVSRYLLADIRSLQAPYIIPNHLAQADPLILRFEQWARENLSKGFSPGKQLKPSQPARAHCSGAATSYSANRRSPTFRIYASSMHNLFCTATVSTSKPSQRRSVTPTVQPYGHSCANAWDAVYAIFAQTCADRSIWLKTFRFHLYYFF